MQTAPHDLAWLNELDAEEARKELLKCCGATRWAAAVQQSRPYRNVEDLLARANDVWWSLTASDWLEAFRSHPKIGEKKAAQPVAAQSQQWSAHEQRGVQDATPEAVNKLARLNCEYEEKFGFIFIVCATGKSSDEILALLEERLQNDPIAELPIAAAEQAKITELRLRTLLEHS
ncbi:MAG: 2-oxo-4-hydroxy-4-carboxy-5-ureidoimidazoline decarboxylase [Acidobacteria bacterium]|nr:2-oxo-4-hydroxy-4-carboxy-5-ureidoimidazoline decarboxylase [Acidobacteriota bacterium]MCA1627825.1 2-oxo-4-hydroxy-4-carboxy-5-ureidoimidazoline decarboxylase [Acidobacteriota bacterium]